MHVAASKGNIINLEGAQGGMCSTLRLNPPDGEVKDLGLVRESESVYAFCFWRKTKKNCYKLTYGQREIGVKKMYCFN